MDTILTQLEEIRSEGKTNMLDAIEVMKQLSDKGYHEAYNAMLTDEGKVDYIQYSKLLTLLRDRDWGITD